MKITGYLLPKIILKPMMTSVQATLVVSNLPGPSDVYMCKKYKLQKMAFFVPHRGTTGNVRHHYIPMYNHHFDLFKFQEWV